MMTEQEKTKLFNTAVSLEQEYNPPLAEHGKTSWLRASDADAKAPGAICQTKIWLRTLGSDRSYEFSTYEVTPSALFVICRSADRYPFQVARTLLDCVLDVTLSESHSPTGGRRYVRFMAKLDRYIDSQEDGEDSKPSGYVLKIIQVSLDDINALEAFIDAVNKAENA